MGGLTGVVFACTPKPGFTGVVQSLTLNDIGPFVSLVRLLTLCILDLTHLLRLLLTRLLLTRLFVESVPTRRRQCNIFLRMPVLKKCFHPLLLLKPIFVRHTALTAC